MSFGRFDITKEVWNFISAHYAFGDLAQQYQLLTSLNQMRQSLGQSIQKFYSQISFLWDQLAFFEPQWICKENDALFEVYKDKIRLNQFFMALNDDFEEARGSLLYRKLLLSLNNAFIEILSEEK